MGLELFSLSYYFLSLSPSLGGVPALTDLLLTGTLSLKTNQSNSLFAKLPV